MNIKIYYQISEIERNIYEFFIQHNYDGELRFAYHCFAKSFRDKDRPWGDEWASFYKKEKYLKTRVLENLFLKENGYEWDGGWTYDDCSEWHDKFYDLDKEYNPIFHKTLDGHPFLARQSGGYMPKPRLSEEELLGRLKIELTKALDTATISL
jgi:hypothetical protein